MNQTIIPRWTNADIERVAAEVKEQQEDHTQYSSLKRFNVPTEYHDGVQWVNPDTLYSMMKPILNGSTPTIHRTDPRGMMSHDADRLVKKYLKELL